MKFVEQRLRDTFKKREAFTKKELEDFFRMYEPDLNEHTFRSRIFHLKKKNIIAQLDKNKYTLVVKKKFDPPLDTELAILDILTTGFMLSEPYCIWNSGWVNQFSRHQAMKNFHIVEANKEELEPLFYHFKDEGLENVFLNPEEDTLYRYARDKEVPIVLKPLISRAPLMEEKYGTKTVIVPTLEKILVDLYTDEAIFIHVDRRAHV